MFEKWFYHLSLIRVGLIAAVAIIAILATWLLIYNNPVGQPPAQEATISPAHALKAILDANPDADRACIGGGWSYLLHSPDETWRLATFKFRKLPNGTWIAEQHSALEEVVLTDYTLTCKDR